MSSVEPRSVRAVMKRILLRTSIIDGQVGGSLRGRTEEGQIADSSRRTGARSRSKYIEYGASGGPLDSSLASNITETVLGADRFPDAREARQGVCAHLSFKLGLKTSSGVRQVEDVLGRFGLQQIQVDCHYLPATTGGCGGRGGGVPPPPTRSCPPPTAALSSLPSSWNHPL